MLPRTCLRTGVSLGALTRAQAFLGCPRRMTAWSQACLDSLSWMPAASRPLPRSLSPPQVPFCERGHPCPRPETPVMFPIVPPPGPKPASPVIGPCHCCLQRLCCLCSTPSSPCGPSLRGLHITRQDCTPGERDTGSKGVQRESTSAGGDLKTFTPGRGPCLYAHRPDSR